MAQNPRNDNPVGDASSISIPDEPTRELTEKVVESATTGKAVTTTLSTSQRIIGRVTDGIYREPWAAFRELIANAYDADARNVNIETSAPDFTQVVVRDDGLGMSPETVSYIVKNIGGSAKRTETGEALGVVQRGELDKSPAGRQLIGKIGIGLFAVAQLTQHFQIVTKRSGERLRTSATIRLLTHDENRYAESSTNREVKSGTVNLLSEAVPDSELDAHGTSIILYHLRPEIRKTLQSVRRWHAARIAGPDGETVEPEPEFHIGVPENTILKGDPGIKSHLPWEPEDSPEQKFEALFTSVGSTSAKGRRGITLEHFDEYLRLIWKLSLSLPLPYLEEDPFDYNSSSGPTYLSIPEKKGQADFVDLQENESLREHFGLESRKGIGDLPFRVVLDGVALSRPIKLPKTIRDPKSRITSPVMMAAKVRAPFKKDELERAGGPLRFEAYLYWNTDIVPKDNAGVLLRVREASGSLFDRSFINYQVSEQNRLQKITAEIFVTEGLDGAINIDRESFNYSHPHYIFIQRWLHRALRLFVNRLKAIAKEDLEREKSRKVHQRHAAIQERAINVWEKRLGEEADPPLDFDKNIPTKSVGGAEIDWGHGEEKDLDSNKANAIAVVLEAYGVLSNLSSRDRARLINDLLNLIESDK